MDVPALGAAVRAGDRRALARAITLVESTRPDHRESAVELLDGLLDATGGAIRVGISGSPGVGKSTFIEAIGLAILRAGHRLAVLAVDPSSRRSGGSILGDKTRMVELSREADAYIRPSPAGETLGGVARRTREALLLCEAGGCDVVLVETVGVGQSETAVAELVDVFSLLVAPGGGDDLQGIKRGIMELADVIVVNKSDGDLAATAERTAADYRNALGLMRPRFADVHPEVLTASALTGAGIDEVWSTVEGIHRQLAASGDLADLRRRQAVAWMWAEVQDALASSIRRRGGGDAVERVEAAVARGDLSPSAGARTILGLA